MAILGDPTVGDRQNDELAYGLSLARALTNAVEVVGEVNGRINSRNGQPPPGTESRGMFRFGGRYTIGSWRAEQASDGYEYFRGNYHEFLTKNGLRKPLWQLAKAGLNENFTLLHQGDDAEHNTATALYEYLNELSAHLSGE